MKEVLKFIIEHPGITIFGAFTLIQIAPIKINPWGWLAKTIKNWLIGDLEKEVKDIRKEVITDRITNKRWSVLGFADSCRQGRSHTKEQWEHCIDELSWYEDYCEKNDITNGVMTQAAAYLKDKYQDHLKNNDFLV